MMARTDLEWKKEKKALLSESQQEKVQAFLPDF
jgi:hypothetical protein